MYERKDIPSMNPELYRRKPKWTVIYNLPTRESAWIGTAWEFYEEESNAQRRYDELVKDGRYPTKRPYHRDNDRSHLAAVHEMNGQG